MEAVPLHYVYGKVNCRWTGEDGTVWAFEPSGFVLYAWDTTAPVPRVAEPVEAKPILTTAGTPEVEPEPSTPVPLVSFSGWQPVGAPGAAHRIVLDDRTASVENGEPPTEPPPEEPK